MNKTDLNQQNETSADLQHAAGLRDKTGLMQLQKMNTRVGYDEPTLGMRNANPDL
jgi:hypothetical protein